MEIISSKTHGYLDYVVALLITASPKIFNFEDKGKAAKYIPIFIGTGALIYGMLTKYKPGLVKAIPMDVHLLLDEISGVFMAASPWLFGFSNKVKVPHLVMGLVEIGAALITKSRNSHS
ncbi:MAG: SPW repeat protein [Bacteroidetes bacterium]|nr:SPW repeat protein [Bacteroidota bacterium]